MNLLYKCIFVTHHKTGHHLCARLAHAISKELGLTFYDLSKVSEIPDDANIIVYESNGMADQSNEYKFESWGGDLKIQKLNFKGVHVIRHPYEIIASAYRWHKIIDAPWVEEEWNGTGKSYKEHLHSEDGIAFEMKNLSKNVIMNIYEFPFFDDKFINIKLEQFEEKFDATIISIAQHLGLPEKSMLKASAANNLNTMTNYPQYVTRKKLDVNSHIALFKPHHYNLFRDIFPSDIFDRLGYSN